MGGLIGINNNNKKKISMTSISLFSSNSNRKSSKCFQPPNLDVVGLGIVAALRDSTQTDPVFANFKPNRPLVFAVSPTRSNPIPISKPLVFPNLNNNKKNNNKNKNNKNSGGGGEMELSEEYTCVISHIGDNLIKKTEYFDGVLANQTHTTASTYLGGGDEVAALKAASFQAADFLKSCNLCNKHLHGLDIFMYRGEKAFCSEECRYEQMVKDERKEKEKEKHKKKIRGSLGKGSTTMKAMMMNKPSFEFSSSTPCSSPIQLIAGIVAA